MESWTINLVTLTFSITSTQGLERGKHTNGPKVQVSRHKKDLCLMSDATLRLLEKHFALFAILITHDKSDLIMLE